MVDISKQIRIEINICNHHLNEKAIVKSIGKYFYYFMDKSRNHVEYYYRDKENRACKIDMRYEFKLLKNGNNSYWSTLILYIPYYGNYKNDVDYIVAELEKTCNVIEKEFIRLMNLKHDTELVKPKVDFESLGVPVIQ